MKGFSVLMSVYKNDDPQDLKESINSLLKQTLIPDEIVIVFDGPVPDDIRNVVDSFTFAHAYLFKIVELPYNAGLGKALSIGLNSCSYDLVARMDADDIAKPDRFEKQISFMEEHPDTDLVGSWIEEFIDVVENVVSLRKVPETNQEIRKFSRLRSPFNHPTVVFKKNTIIEVGGYFDYGTFEDYHLWARLVLNKKKCYNIQESLLYFRTSRDTYKRRGGWKKTMAEFQLQRYFLTIGFIDRTEFMRNVLSRGAARLVPNFVRKMLYKYVLSSKKEIGERYP
jgi:glycosyltransferase involved in cell wall biosynthesis